MQRATFGWAFAALLFVSAVARNEPLANPVGLRGYNPGMTLAEVMKVSYPTWETL
jgi:hypothetical protein